MDCQKIKIKTNGGVSDIYIDDTRIKFVESLKLEHSVKTEIPILTLKIYAIDCEIEEDNAEIKKTIVSTNTSIDNIKKKSINLN